MSMQKLSRALAIVLLLAAMVLGALALATARRHTTTVPVHAVAAAPADPRSLPVVVAAVPLKAGQPLPPAALRVENQPSRPEGAFASVEPLAGALPRQDVAAGTVITQAMLTQGVAMQLKPGERALAVPVDELAGAGNRVAPGDYVDVFITLRERSPAISSGHPSPGDAPQTRLLLSRVRVLAYGSLELPSVGNAEAAAVSRTGAANAAEPSSRQSIGNGDSARSKDGVETARTAVLAVPVQSTDRLLLGAQSGKLALALRHPADPGMPDAGLFPTPRTVLAARRDLPAEVRDRLNAPENRAFAGIDLAALADGQADAPSRPVTSATRAAKPVQRTAVEIIRGDGTANGERNP